MLFSLACCQKGSGWQLTLKDICPKLAIGAQIPLQLSGATPHIPIVSPRDLSGGFWVIPGWTSAFNSDCSSCRNWISMDSQAPQGHSRCYTGFKRKYELTWPEYRLIKLFLDLGIEEQIHLVTCKQKCSSSVPTQTSILEWNKSSSGDIYFSLLALQRVQAD